MSLNRFRIPGHLILEVRFTSDDEPWLSKLTRDDIAYALGYAAGEPGTAIHAALVVGNCCALLGTDTTGLFSRCTQRLHTCLTEMCNDAHNRERGTIWDNRAPSESFVIGWEAAKFVLRLFAIHAADAAASSEPYDWPGYFGPRMWGTHNRVERSDRLGRRSTRPTRVFLNPKVPECAPSDAHLEDLVEDVDADNHRSISQFRRSGGHRRRADKPKLAAGFGEFVGPDEVVSLLQKELDLWRAYYQRCRREFPEHQLVAFPAGTCKFRELGAAVDPCPTYVAPPQPRRRRAPRPPP